MVGALSLFSSLWLLISLTVPSSEPRFRHSPRNARARCSSGDNNRRHQLVSHMLRAILWGHPRWRHSRDFFRDNSTALSLQLIEQQQPGCSRRSDR
jgi:hypothetical protein